MIFGHFIVAMQKYQMRNKGVFIIYVWGGGGGAVKSGGGCKKSPPLRGGGHGSFEGGQGSSRWVAFFLYALLHYTQRSMGPTL